MAGLLFGVVSILPAQTVSITSYPLDSSTTPLAITAGPDGALWFTAFTIILQDNGLVPIEKIGRISTSGAVTEYPLPPIAFETSADELVSIVIGSDGALWFAERDRHQIGRITTGGAITEYPIPSFGFPLGIAAGPDGALWFTELLGPQGCAIGRVSTSGAFTEYPYPRLAPCILDGSSFFAKAGITAGPDGALWFTEIFNRIGRISTAGVLTEHLLYQVPPANGPFGIAVGSDGALWFTEVLGSKIGRITTAGALTEYPLPTLNQPTSIAAGPDGALWFIENGQIGRITTAGEITEYAAPAVSSVFPSSSGITAGPDGAMWFVEPGAIGRVSIGQPCTPSFSPSGQSFATQGGLGSFTVNTGPFCTWSAVPGASWITILPSAHGGTGKVNYLVAANSGVARNGAISVGGQQYSISQAGTGCAGAYSINPADAVVDNFGGTVRTVVIAPPGCPWTSTSNAGWLTVASGASGSGNGAVVLSAAPNPGGSRSGTVTIAGKTLSVFQGLGAACGAFDLGALTLGAEVALNLSPLRYTGFAGSNTYSQTVSITNNNRHSGVIPGPIYFVPVGMPTHNPPYPFGLNSGLLGAPPGTTFTTCFTSAGDYLIPISGDLQPGQSSIPLSLTWVDGGAGLLIETPRVISGTPNK